MEDAARRVRNVQRLAECFPTFAARVGAVIDDMETAGFRPRIQDGFRSIADQLKAFNGGFSHVKFGFHNVTGANGRAESLAVDMIDDSNPLASGRRYVVTLASFAQKHGLASGITFRLKTAPERAALQKAIDTLDFDTRVRIGFDPTHLEPKGLTITQARDGARPQ